MTPLFFVLNDGTAAGGQGRRPEGDPRSARAGGRTSAVYGDPGVWACVCLYLVAVLIPLNISVGLGGYSARVVVWEASLISFVIY